MAFSLIDIINLSKIVDKYIYIIFQVTRRQRSQDTRILPSTESPLLLFPEKTQLFLFRIIVIPSILSLSISALDLGLIESIQRHDLSLYSFSRFSDPGGLQLFSSERLNLSPFRAALDPPERWPGWVFLQRSF